jgi:hypothetical protein
LINVGLEPVVPVDTGTRATVSNRSTSAVVITNAACGTSVTVDHKILDEGNTFTGDELGADIDDEG